MWLGNFLVLSNVLLGKLLISSQKSSATKIFVLRKLLLNAEWLGWRVERLLNKRSAAIKKYLFRLPICIKMVTEIAPNWMQSSRNVIWIVINTDTTLLFYLFRTLLFTAFRFHISFYLQNNPSRRSKTEIKKNKKINLSKNFLSQLDIFIIEKNGNITLFTLVTYIFGRPSFILWTNQTEFAAK